MQTGSEQLKSQQSVMQSRNMYQGKIDGIWGPKSIAAKVKWERSGKFAPAIPNNGFPLPDRGPFPPGVRRLKDGTLTCTELETRVTTKIEAPLVATPVEAPVVEPKLEGAFPVPQVTGNQPQQDRQNKGKFDGNRK